MGISPERYLMVYAPTVRPSLAFTTLPSALAPDYLATEWRLHLARKPTAYFSVGSPEAIPGNRKPRRRAEAR